MDNITHMVMGAAIGEAVAGRRLGKKAMLWGAIAANVPDVDVFFAGFQSVPDSLLSHRGFTHSILFCVIATLLFSLLMARWKGSGSNDFRLWAILISAGLFSHLLIDACTSYGTGWFEPFSHYRVSFNNLFVVDPFYTLPMLVSFIALLVLRRESRVRKWWNILGFGISTVYLVFTFINKINVDSITEDNLSADKIKWKTYITTPAPLSNFLWYIDVKDSAGFYVGYHSIFDKSDRLNLYYFPQHKEMLANYKNEEEIRKLIRFSQGYYCVTKDSSGIDFHDLRFGQTNGWNDPASPFAFSYHLGHDKDNTLVIQRGRIKVASHDALHSLIERIKGN